MTSWHQTQRLEAVHRLVLDCGARTVLDLGCGPGDLLTRLATEPRLERIVGLDLSAEALERSRARLDSIACPEARERAARVELVQASMTATGTTYRGFDCALLVETIEHMDPERLSVVERALFDSMRPRTVVLTTPNADFNPFLEVPAHRFRHPDHRFEWGRARFARWVEGVACRNDYQATCSTIGGRHPRYGGATQLAVFRLSGDR
ncbi:MAG: methyltransferase domain-containing protein [bacterium]